MKLKDIFDVVHNFTKISLYLKIGGVLLHCDNLLLETSFQMVERFYDFKVTELETDAIGSETVLVVYAEEN